MNAISYPGVYVIETESKATLIPGIDTVTGDTSSDGAVIAGGVASAVETVSSANRPRSATDWKSTAPSPAGFVSSSTAIVDANSRRPSDCLSDSPRCTAFASRTTSSGKLLNHFSSERLKKMYEKTAIAVIGSRLTAMK